MDIIRSFFVEDDLKNLLGWLGINYKKAMKNRILISIVVILVIVFLGFYFKNIYMMFLSIVIGIFYYKYQYFSIKNKRKKIIALKRKMFPAFVKKMLILIRTNNIYNALIKMIEYTDYPIKKYLEDLIDDIKEDKSMKPFNKFANQMEFIEAYQIMAMLFTFSEHAMNKKHLVSLEVMISQLYDSEIDEMIESKKRLLWLFPNITILTMLVMVFSIAIYIYIYNSIVNSAYFKYDRLLKRKKYLKVEDIIQEVVLKEYKKNSKNSRLSILKDYLSNTNRNVQFKNKYKIEQAIKNINFEMEEAQEKFHDLFKSNSYNNES